MVSRYYGLYQVPLVGSITANRRSINGDSRLCQFSSTCQIADPVVKENRPADDVRDVSRQLRILVKDTAKKLRTAIQHDYAGRASNEIDGHLSK